MHALLRIVSVALCAFPWSIGAQTSAHFEAGGARVRYGDSVAVSAGTVSAAAAALTRTTSFSGIVAGSATQGSSWTIFGAGDGALFTPNTGAFRGELYGSGSGTSYGSNTGSGRLLGGARLHLAGPRAGTWVGFGAGTVVDEIGSRGIRQGEAGVWAELGRAVAQLAVIPVRMAGEISYTDIEGSVRFGSSSLDFGAVAGFRSSVRGYADNAGAWASVNATAWLLRAVGITAAIGNYPADIGQGLPSASYLSLGVRLAPRRIIPPTPPLPSELAALPRPDASPAMTVSAGSNGRRTITLRAPAARRVEIMGDFTDWAPRAMAAAETPGAWTLSLPIPSGAHQVNVRLDGGAWIVPSGLTAVRDEFGGSVGILLVP